jgi:hypothetical protein
LLHSKMYLLRSDVLLGVLKAQFIKDRHRISISSFKLIPTYY